MIIAQMSVYPIGEGTSLSKYVSAAGKALEQCNVRLYHGPMSTAMEAETLDDIFAATKAARNAILEMGAKRISINLKIDDRHDKNITFESKQKAFE